VIKKIYSCKIIYIIYIIKHQIDLIERVEKKKKTKKNETNFEWQRSFAKKQHLTLND
jgi:hypothetical protein